MVERLETPYTESEILASLTPIVRDWFLERFTTFSPPQRYSILNIKRRKNTLISSPTGSGKTLSAFLAILDDLIRDSLDGRLEDKVYCVYVSPLKALGNDIEKNLSRPLQELQERAGRDLGIRVGIRTGDTPAHERSRMLKRPPHILITTPESLAIMLTSPKFSTLLHGIDWAVIDEVHALAENKRGTQLALVLERLSAQTFYTRIGLSATVAPLEDVAEYLVGLEGGDPRPCDVVDVNYEKDLDIEVLSPVDNLIATTHAQLLDKQYALLDRLVQEHRTTIIFTNTRAATERVVHQLKRRYPSHYTDTLATVDDASDESGDIRTTIAAHHGSLSKEHRLAVEEQLRRGQLRCVVSSTSLELGIDIGFVDLVILLGSPKSVARALQRIGRSGHRIHDTAKGRIVVLDRDDLVECSVLAREALNRHIDRIHIPEGALDVLSQEIYGIAIQRRISIQELYSLVTGAYPYRHLSRTDLLSVIRYLAGEFAALEERHVYAKIWYDENEGMIGRKGRLARMLYSTNVGTIPDQTDVVVKLGGVPIGSISEPFLESLKTGDVFVLGGEAYQFRYSRGMTAQVTVADGRRPTVPSWFSQMLPLSYDLSIAVQEFRGHLEELFRQDAADDRALAWIQSFVPVDDNAAKSILEYARQQYLYARIPTRHRLVVEHFSDHNTKYAIFHSLYGRRVNDVLSRALGYALGRIGAGDVEIGLSDNGFYLRYKRAVPVMRGFRLLHASELRDVMERALERTEVLLRRFRHCAGRSLMILRSYKGNRKTVGRQQVSSRLLMAAVRRLKEDFPILREARREVLEDLMDVEHAREVLAMIEERNVQVEEITTDVPSPFAFSLVLQGYADVMRMEERQEFLRRLHREVLAKMSLSKTAAQLASVTRPEDFSYEEEWEQHETPTPDEERDTLKQSLYEAAQREDVPAQYVYELQRVIEGDRDGFPEHFVLWLDGLLSKDSDWPDRLLTFLRAAAPDLNWR